MAASPAMVHELEAASVIRKCHEYGAFFLVKPSGRIGVYRHHLVPLGVLQQVRELYPQIRVLLLRLAQ